MALCAQARYTVLGVIMLKILFSLLAFSPAYGANWTCETDGTYVEGNKIYACGVGTDYNEEEARKKAYIYANNEAIMIYNQTTNFKGPLSFFPRRQNCFIQNRFWKCHRLLLVVVGETPPTN